MGSVRRQRPQTISFRDRNSWFHTMFWAIIAVAVTPAAAGGALLSGVPVGLVSVGANLWVIAVLVGSVCLAELTKNPRIISSDRLVNRIVARHNRTTEQQR